MSVSTRMFLCGFMASGKSTLGRMAAQTLGYDFIDTDHEIERSAGMPISDIFSREGEAGFRRRETALVADLISRQRIVVATGGGMVVNAAIRDTLKHSGPCVRLTATPAEYARRLGPHAAERRPMLQAADLTQRITELLAEREPAYGDLHYTLDTSLDSPEVLTQRLARIVLAEHERLPVRTPGGGSYDIVLGRGLIDQLGPMLAGRGWARRATIITDTDVGPLYAPAVQRALGQAGMDSFVATMPAGESAKHLRTVEDLYRALAEGGVDRNTPVIALGGGVVGDTAGFVAATYLRGLPFVQVPTSLLAMADSSIGGKVGVDTSFGKNLVGAFKQPELVVADLATLASLPAVERQCGLAEIIKAGLIDGGDAWARAQTISQSSPVTAPLLDAIRLKRRIVEEDPFEQNKRAWLNLGHTFGHGLESWSEFRIKHGQAVALGLVCAARASITLGLCDPTLEGDAIRALAAAGLPTTLSALGLHLTSEDVDAVWKRMGSDKKRKGGALRYVLLRAVGDPVVTDKLSEADARAILARI
ncbi:MAG: 3-dehydroquinate synthase [Thermoflexales bacterium]